MHAYVLIYIHLKCYAMHCNTVLFSSSVCTTLTMNSYGMHDTMKFLLGSFGVLLVACALVETQIMH